MKRVYKKETAVFDISSGISRNVEDICLIFGGYLCKIVDKSLVSATRIHPTSLCEAIDLEGYKYTFSDSCFIVSRTLGGRREIHSNYEIIDIDSTWTKTCGTLEGANVSFGVPVYTLTPGSRIILDKSYVVVDTQLCGGCSFVYIRDSSNRGITRVIIVK